MGVAITSSLIVGHCLAVTSQLTATHPTAAPCWLQAIPLLKESIKKAYGKKGDKIVNMNWAGELKEGTWACSEHRHAVGQAAAALACRLLPNAPCCL